MKKWRNIILVLITVICLVMIIGCTYEESSDNIQSQQQEVLNKEATSQVGMPSITNFFERRLVKQILEMRDNPKLITYTYLYSEVTGKLTYFGQTIGYGIPYATQYTNPMKFDYKRIDTPWGMEGVEGTIPQADPNGLYSPSSAEGTWVLMKDPNSSDVLPIYVESRIIVSPFKLNL